MYRKSYEQKCISWHIGRSDVFLTTWKHHKWQYITKCTSLWRSNSVMASKLLLCFIWATIFTTMTKKPTIVLHFTNKHEFYSGRKFSKLRKSEILYCTIYEFFIDQSETRYFIEYIIYYIHVLHYNTIVLMHTLYYTGFNPNKTLFWSKQIILCHHFQTLALQKTSLSGMWLCHKKRTKFRSRN